MGMVAGVFLRFGLDLVRALLAYELRAALAALDLREQRAGDDIVAVFACCEKPLYEIELIHRLRRCVLSHETYWQPGRGRH